MRKLTIYEALQVKLGRTPTHKEQCDEVKRILDENWIIREQEKALKQ